MTTNYAMLIRREMISRIGKHLIDGNLYENVDAIPFIMRPKNNKGVRCCVHKERAVIKYKVMAFLGYNVYDEPNEMTPLKDYVKSAFEKKEDSGIHLTVVDEACSSCVKSNYIVTNLCKGCVARPCTYVCKKEAIVITDQAHIQIDKCVNCGLCMQACPFHAIIYQPVPCEEACPVGALSKDENGVESIDVTKCIYCGRCMVACPFGAIMEKSQLLQIYEQLRNGKTLVAMLAPALAGQFKTEFGRLITAVKNLGFKHVIEVAEGANITTKNETEEFKERILEKGEPFMTTSCCPSYINLVNQHLPELKPFVSHTKTPMSYTADIVKERFGKDALAVFISPCVAKRSEAFRDENTDYVMSIEELASLFVSAGIDVMTCEEATLDQTIDKDGRLYAISGGVANSIKNKLEDGTLLKAHQIDGIDKASIRDLKAFTKGTCPGNIVEVMSCQGGCVNGCDTISVTKIATKQIQKLAEKN